MKTFALSLVLLLAFAALRSTAQEPAAEGGDGLDLRNKSVFHADPGMHNPFWPIGWEKGAAASGPAAQTLGAAAFSVTSILLGNPSIAVINGREYEEGQELRGPAGQSGSKVAAIRDGNVVLRSGDAEVTVELQRK